MRASRGRRDTQPPSQVDSARFVALADELTPPSFAAFLDVAVHQGMRPGELDALTWSQIDFQAGTILVDRQWNAKVKKFTPPKHGSVSDDRAHRRRPRPAAPAAAGVGVRVHDAARAATTPTSRSYHWNRVRCSAGLGNVDLYTATRHYFGWYAWNVLELDARDIALHFGHQDGGELVRKLYGHPTPR